MSRKTLQFEVTPKGGADQRRRGRAPNMLWGLTAVVGAVLVYAFAGMLGWVPWRTGTGSTVASGVWLALAGMILLLGTKRIRSVSFATSRRNAYRVTLKTPIEIDDVRGELVDISVGGAAVRFPLGTLPSTGLVQFHLPGVQPIKMEMLRHSHQHDDFDRAFLRALDTDWTAFREMSRWLFHTPPNAVPGLLPGVPVIATLSPIALVASHAPLRRSTVRM